MVSDIIIYLYIEKPAILCVNEIKIDDKALGESDVRL
jgi:hypothetical protein